jgi:RHS repeat-associated protein
MNRFTGYYKDFESGMDYANARYRDIDFKSPDDMWHLSPDVQSYHYCRWNPVMYVDPSGLDPYIVFDGETNKISIYDNSKTPEDLSDDVFLGSYDAHNNVDKRSNGKWEDGKYEMEDKKRPLSHGDKVDKKGVKKDSPNGEYGKNGIYRAKNFKETTTDKTRSGMGVHSGREHKKFKDRFTMGCIRTTPEAVEAIQSSIDNYGPLQSIYVTNNRQSANSPFVNNLNFGMPATAPEFIIPTMNIAPLPQDNTKMVKSFFITK